MDTLPTCPHQPATLAKSFSPNLENGGWRCQTCHGTAECGLWLCVECGNISCGRYSNGHALAHFSETGHPMAMNLSNTACYCYQCDAFVAERSGPLGKLRQRLAAAQRQERVSPGYVLQAPVDVMELRGRMGLSNLGNTCFMNSVLQVLSNTSELRDRAINDTDVVDCSSGSRVAPSTGLSVSPKFHKNRCSSGDVSLYTELVVLLRNLWRPSGFATLLEPNQFFGAVTRVMPYFGGYHQQDAHEFLRYLCDRLHSEHLLSSGQSHSPLTDLGRRVDDVGSSVVSDVFGCELLNEMHCLRCGHVSHKVDPCLDLSLDVPAELSRQFYTRVKDGINNRGGSDNGADEIVVDPLDKFGGESFMESGTSAFMKSDDRAPSAKRAKSERYIPRPCRLYDCLRGFSSCERLKDTEKYRCPRCSLNGRNQEQQAATKQMALKTLPGVLCIHLKRFHWTLTSRAKMEEFATKPDMKLRLQESVACSSWKAASSNGRVSAAPIDLSSLSSSSTGSSPSPSDASLAKEKALSAPSVQPLSTDTSAEKDGSSNLQAITPEPTTASAGGDDFLDSKDRASLDSTGSGSETDVDRRTSSVPLEEEETAVEAVATAASEVVAEALAAVSSATLGVGAPALGCAPTPVFTPRPRTPLSTATPYDLYAVVVHHGSGFGSGHYTCYCRSHEGGEWYHYNDSIVSPVAEEVVARSQAYMLFYAARTTKPA